MGLFKKNPLKAIGDKIGDVVDPIKDKVNDVLDPVGDFIREDITTPIKDTTNRALDPIGDFLREDISNPIKETVQENIIDPTTNLYRNTIMNPLEEVKDEVVGAGASVLDVATDPFGIGYGDKLKRETMGLFNTDYEDSFTARAGDTYDALVEGATGMVPGVSQARQLTDPMFNKDLYEVNPYTGQQYKKDLWEGQSKAEGISGGVGKVGGGVAMSLFLGPTAGIGGISSGASDIVGASKGYMDNPDIEAYNEEVAAMELAKQKAQNYANIYSPGANPIYSNQYNGSFYGAYGGNLNMNPMNEYKQGGKLNFGSSAAYKKWLAYGHASGKFASTPGNQKVSIRGKSHRVKHQDGGEIVNPYGITEYNGLLHEEGGIPINDMNEVESGETKGMPNTYTEDYIFSDRLKLPKSKKTFADASKDIEKKYDLRGGDELAVKAKQEDLNKLMDSQEQLRDSMFNKVMDTAYGSTGPYRNNLSRELQGGLQPQGRSPQVLQPEKKFYANGGNTNVPDNTELVQPYTQDEINELTQGTLEFNPNYDMGKIRGLTDFNQIAVGTAYSMPDYAVELTEKVNPETGLYYDPEKAKPMQQAVSNIIEPSVRQWAATNLQAPEGQRRKIAVTYDYRGIPVFHDTGEFESDPNYIAKEATPTAKIPRPDKITLSYMKDGKYYKRQLHRDGTLGEERASNATIHKGDVKKNKQYWNTFTPEEISKIQAAGINWGDEIVEKALGGALSGNRALLNRTSLGSNASLYQRKLNNLFNNPLLNNSLYNTSVTPVSHNLSTPVVSACGGKMKKKADGGVLNVKPGTMGLQNYGLDSNYTTSPSYLNLAPALGYIPGLIDIFQGPDEVSYERVNLPTVNTAKQANLVDYGAERANIQQQADLQQRMNRANARKYSSNANQLMSHVAAGNVPVQRTLGQMYGQSTQNEANTNAQILNQAIQRDAAINAQNQAREAMMNTQLTNQERIANQRTKDAYMQNISNTLMGLGQTAAGFAGSIQGANQANAYNAAMFQNMQTPNYGINPQNANLSYMGSGANPYASQASAYPSSSNSGYGLQAITGYTPNPYNYLGTNPYIQKDRMMSIGSRAKYNPYLYNMGIYSQPQTNIPIDYTNPYNELGY